MSEKTKTWSIKTNGDGIEGFMYSRKGSDPKKLYTLATSEIGITLRIVEYMNEHDEGEQTTKIDEYLISKGNEKVCIHRQETHKQDYGVEGCCYEYIGIKDKTETFDKDCSALIEDFDAFQEIAFYETDRSDQELKIKKVREAEKAIKTAVSKADIRLIPRGSERGCEINMFYGGAEENFERSKSLAEWGDDSKYVAEGKKFRQLPSMPRFWKYIFVDFNKYNGIECTNIESSPSVDEAAEILKGIKKVRKYNPENGIKGKEVLDITQVLSRHYNPNCVVNHEKGKIQLRIGNRPVSISPEMTEKEREPFIDYIVCYEDEAIKI